MARNKLDGYNRINHDEQKEINKIRARKMAVTLGIACVIFLLAMIAEVYL